MEINPVYEQIYTSKKRYKVLKGGAGSGKSYAITQIEILKAIEKKERTLWIRKVADTIRTSIFQLVQDVLDNDGFRKGIDYTANKTEMTYTFSNGSKFIMKGIDDQEKMKSIAGITRIVIEEATELDEEDFTQLDLRLRGKTLKNPSITLMFNPISANHWLCKRFDRGFDAERMLFLNTTYKDNEFLDDDYIQMLENLVNIDENLYRIYVKNEWGIEDPDKLFAKNYSQNLHFGKSYKSLYNPNSDVYLAWDFNVQNTCLAIQVPEEGVINVLKEYHFKGVDIYNLCIMIEKDFEGHHLIINGDASGNNRSAFTSDNDTAYQILQSALGLDWSQFRVPNVNPSHQNSRTLTNLVFKFCQVNISSECKQLDTDLISVEIDEKGSLNEYKKKHADRTHWLDPLRYHFSAEHSHVSRLLDIKKTG